MAYIGTKPSNQVIDSIQIADGTVTPSDLSTGHPSWDSSGNLGAGATPISGYGKLQVRNGFAYINEDGADTKQLYIRTSFGGNPAIQIATNDPLLFATNNTERMRIDSSGRVTKPYQPAFQAVGNSGSQAYGNGAQFIMGATTYNQGSGYNTANGRYTAPVTGFYSFSYGVYCYSSSKQVCFKKNGADYVPSDNIGLMTVPADGTAIGSIQIYLTAGDYVGFGFRDGTSGSIYLSHTFFSGYLIG